MWYAVIIRILRRRVVLAIIFCLSLTYCLVNLFGNVSENTPITEKNKIAPNKTTFAQNPY